MAQRADDAPDSERDPYAAVDARRRSLSIIHDLALALLKRYSLEDLLWLIAQSTISKLGFEDCVIYLIDGERQVLIQRAAYGPKVSRDYTIVDPIEIPLGKGIVGRVAESQKAELIGDVTQDASYIVDDEARMSELAVPIVHEGRILGVIDSEHSQPNFYTPDHLEMLTIIASMASTKIATALTIEKLNRTVAQLEQTRNALRDQERSFRDLYNLHPSMFFSVDTQGTVLSTNDYACEHLGFSRSEIEGQAFSALVSGGESGDVGADLGAAAEAGGSVHRWEASISHKDGSSSWLRLTARAVEADTGPRILIVAEDITETHVLAQELEFNARRDWLTGLYNRREFETRLRAAIRIARRDEVDYALCFVDLDRFKVVNDTCGHAAGDAVLRRVARCFESNVRKSDIVARIGGDEFGVLMPDCSLADAQRWADALLEAIAEEPFTWEEHLFPLAASVGVASLRVGSGGPDDVLSAADAACLSAKSRGRNRVQVYRERDFDIANRKGQTQWVSRINRALNQDGFELFYQPVARLEPNGLSVTHFEVLLRMIGDDGELILPDTFIPAAERYDLGLEVDEWVVAHSLDWIADQPNREHTWAINLSGTSVGNPTFLEWLSTRLQTSGVDPGRLCFEITETAAISDWVAARPFVERLQKLGCLFALDDFGSGLSSLAYLKQLPADLIKFDGAFIADIHCDPVNHSIVRSINDVGHLMGKRTVAEFVDTPEILETLRQIGVDYAQGFAIAKPRPLREFSMT
ncbi:MAG: EAL domain-containing protein [Pseudomonadota bacterium]